MGILSGKVAIVTGAGSGIGSAIALAYSQEGARVALVDINGDACEAAANIIRQENGHNLALTCDVSKRSEVNAVVAETVDSFGTIDILVNSAFSNPSFNRNFEDQTENDLMANLASSLLGTWNFMQACFPYLHKCGGKVINFSSAAFTEGQSGSAPYAAAKGAVVGLSNCLCLEWGKFGININLISPIAWTAQYDVFLRSAPPGAHEAFIAQNPMGRLGDPDKDVARVAVFLAGPDSNYITGRTISVDGGRGLLRV